MVTPRTCCLTTEEHGTCGLSVQARPKGPGRAATSAGPGRRRGEAGRDVYPGVGCGAVLVECADEGVGCPPHQAGRGQVSGCEQDAAARADARRVRLPSADAQFG